MKELTEKQKKILDFIEDFLEREGMAPTVYEIADNFDIKTSTVFAHLRALQRKKQLSRSSKARSISLASRRGLGGRMAPHGAFMVPLLGRVTAGLPTESSELREGEVCVEDAMLNGVAPEDVFSLRVRGESMRDLGIYEGDIVIVARQNGRPRPGDIVVALVRGDEVTVKSFFPRNDGKIELRPANAEFKVQIYTASDVQIQGRVIGLHRKY
ncbi:MAG: transcriptional repressor LexA [Victivallaceae bacterium]|nr:transcriptional repressor LexA [Victivallaceae bacterium]